MACAGSVDPDQPSPEGESDVGIYSLTFHQLFCEIHRKKWQKVWNKLFRILVIHHNSLEKKDSLLIFELWIYLKKNYAQIKTNKQRKRKPNKIKQNKKKKKKTQANIM